MTGVADRRGADAQMDFGRAGTPQQRHDARRCRPAHDAVVDQSDALATQHFWQRVELQVDTDLTLLLMRLNERPADISVFDQPLAIRQTGGASETDRGRRG